MQRLKLILADKILDLSSTDSVEVRLKLDKIQRFRDFADACASLMVRYPVIEDVLVAMAEDNNFDTKDAASRVDSAIAQACGEIEENTKLSDFSDNKEIEIQSKTDTVAEIAEENVLYPSEEELDATKRKITIRRAVQILILILAMAVLIFIINFIREYWQIILIVVGLLVILSILLVWFMRKRN